MSFESLLNSSANFQRTTTTAGSIGEPVESWASISGASAVPCRIELLSMVERLLAGREGTMATHRLFIGAGYSITHADRVIVSSATYSITGSGTYQNASMDHHAEYVLNITS